jgi:uncharacterized membrane protein YhdT
MKSKFDRYMKDTVWFSVAFILLYLFLYMTVRIMLSMIVGSYDLSIGYDMLCHLFSFVLLVIIILSNENNDNSPNAT